MKLSYSAISTYQTCPLQYKFRYIDKLPTVPSIAMGFGSVLHTTLETLYKEQKDLESLLRYLGETWNSNIKQESTEALYTLDTAKAIITSYYEKHVEGEENPFDKVVALEEWFEVPLEGNHSIRGKVDRIDVLPNGNHEIIDYKTGKRLPNQKDVDGDLQLSIYHWAANEVMPGINPERLTLHFLRQNERCYTFRDELSIAETERVVHEAIASIEHDLELGFLPKKNNLCPWCDFQEQCAKSSVKKAPTADTSESLFDYLQATTPIVPAAEVEKDEVAHLVDEYIDLKASEQELKDRLFELQTAINKYCMSHGLQEFKSSKGTIIRTPGGKLTVVRELK